MLHPGSGGVSVKIRDVDHYETAPQGILQAEYTMGYPNFYYDLSYIDCNRYAPPEAPDYCPFAAGGVRMYTSNETGTVCPQAHCQMPGECVLTYLDHGFWLDEPSLSCPSGNDLFLETCVYGEGQQTVEKPVYLTPDKPANWEPEEPVDWPPEEPMNWDPEKLVYSTPEKTVYSTPEKSVYSTPDETVYSTPEETVYSTPEETTIPDADPIPEVSLTLEPPQAEFPVPPMMKTYEGPKAEPSEPSQAQITAVTQTTAAAETTTTTTSETGTTEVLKSQNTEVPESQTSEPPVTQSTDVPETQTTEAPKTQATGASQTQNTRVSDIEATTELGGPASYQTSETSQNQTSTPTYPLSVGTGVYPPVTTYTWRPTAKPSLYPSNYESQATRRAYPHPIFSRLRRALEAVKRNASKLVD
jgi:hypothetical protein